MNAPDFYTEHHLRALGLICSSRFRIFWVLSNYGGGNDLLDFRGIFRFYGFLTNNVVWVELAPGLKVLTYPLDRSPDITLPLTK